jgi:hypothetical protein
MATGKKSFILYCDIINTVAKLPDEQAGKLFKIILEYVNDNNPETDDLLLQIAFEPIRQQLKRDLQEWEVIREKRVAAGKASADLRKQNQQVLTHVESVEQKEQVSTVNVTVTDTVTVTDNVDVKKKEKKVKGVFTPPSLESVLSYCKERKQSDEFGKKFYDYFTAGNWIDGKGQKVLAWKQKFISWENRSGQSNPEEKKITKIKCEYDGREYLMTQQEYDRGLEKCPELMKFIAYV